MASLPLRASQSGISRTVLRGVHEPLTFFALDPPLESEDTHLSKGDSHETEQGRGVKPASQPFQRTFRFVHVDDPLARRAVHDHAMREWARKKKWRKKQQVQTTNSPPGYSILTCSSEPSPNFREWTLKPKPGTKEDTRTGPRLQASMGTHHLLPAVNPISLTRSSDRTPDLRSESDPPPPWNPPAHPPNRFSSDTGTSRQPGNVEQPIGSSLQTVLKANNVDSFSTFPVQSDANAQALVHQGKPVSSNPFKYYTRRPNWALRASSP